MVTAICIYKTYPVKYKSEVLSQAEKYGVDKNLVFAIIKCESGFNPNAKSNKGAVGLMQLMPETAEFISVKIAKKNYDLSSPTDNISLGVAYLKYLIDKFGETLALYCYNAGEGRVKRFLDGGGNIKFFPYAETTTYVKKVLKAKRQYQKLQKLPFRN